MSRKFSGKCKKGFHLNFRRSWKILEVQPQKLIGWTRPFFLWPHLYQVCFESNFMGKVVGVTILNILKIARAMLMNFGIVNIPRCQILIWSTKLVSADFCLWKSYFKKWNAMRNQTPLQLQPSSSPLSYFGVTSVKMFVLKHWVFL